MFQEINFHPMRNNILDFVGRQDLRTISGKSVIISRCVRGVGFIVKVDNQVSLESDCNLTVSGYLNKLRTGKSANFQR